MCACVSLSAACVSQLSTELENSRRHGDEQKDIIASTVSTMELSELATEMVSTLEETTAEKSELERRATELERTKAEAERQCADLELQRDEMRRALVRCSCVRFATSSSLHAMCTLSLIHI